MDANLTNLRSEAIKKARDQLDDAIWNSLESLLKRWARTNLVLLDETKLREALEKLTEGAS